MDPAWSSWAAYSTERDLAMSTAKKVRKAGAGTAGRVSRDADFLPNPDGFLRGCLWFPQNPPTFQSRLLIRGHRFGPLSLAPKLAINQEAGLGAAADPGNSASAAPGATQLWGTGVPFPQVPPGSYFI